MKFLLLSFLLVSWSSVQQLRPHLQSTYQLEESNDAILGDIQDVRLSPDGRQVLLYDGETQSLFLYNKSGKLLTVFRADVDLSDSLVKSKKAFSTTDTLVDVSSISQAFRIPRAKLLPAIRGEIRGGCFLSDSEIAAGVTVRAWMYRPSDPRSAPPTYTGIRAAVVVYNLNSSARTFHVLDAGPADTDPMDYSMQYDPIQKRFVLPVMNSRARHEGKWDSTYGLGACAVDGRFLRAYTHLPKEYTTSGLGYDFLDYRVSCSKGSFVFIPTKVPVVHDSEGKPLFTLRGVEDANSAFFREATLANKGVDISWDSILSHRSFECYQLDRNADGSLAVMFVTYRGIGSSPLLHIQSYGMSGDLLRECTCDSSELGHPLMAAHFDPRTQEVLLYYTKDEHWMCSTYRLERLKG